METSPQSAPAQLETSLTGEKKQALSPEPASTGIDPVIPPSVHIPTPGEMLRLANQRHSWFKRNHPTTPRLGEPHSPRMEVEDARIDQLGGDGRKDRRENKLGWFNTSQAPDDYLVAVEHPDGEQNAPVMSIRARSGNPKPWGTASYTVDIDQVSGRNVTISADIKTENLDQGAFWASASGEDFRQIAYQSAAFYKSFDWTGFTFSVSVPKEARKFQVGLTLNGRQAIHLRNLRVTAPAP